MDVVTIGETMTLFVPEEVGSLRFSQTFKKTIGGAESNVAIALSRLGHSVGWISRLGDDEFGLFIRNFLRGEGVDTSNVIFDSTYPTAVFFKERQHAQDPKVFYYRKGSAASFLSPSDLNEEYIKKAKFLHVSGITPALSESCKETIFEAIKMARKNKMSISFDPNIRLKLWGKEEASHTLCDVALKCDIVMPGLDEGEILTGKNTPEEISSYFLERGVKTVVVKLGSKGAYYASNDSKDYVSGFEVKNIVDTVGAGDGFAAGFLSGLLRGFDLRESTLLANRIGAFALTVAGDVEGYPFWRDLDPSSEKSILR